MYCWGGSHGYACLKPKTHPKFGCVFNLPYKQVLGRLGCELQASRKRNLLEARGSKLEAHLLLLLFLFLSGFRSRLRLCLRLGLFHRFLGFGNPLGAGFGALFTLLIKDLFAAQKLDERLFRSIALLPCSAHDAQIPAIAIAKTRCDGVEQLDHGFVRHQVRRGEAPSREIATLAQCDHLFDMWAHGFRFRDRGLDPLFHNQRSHQIPQQRSPVRSVPSKFPASYFVTHDKTSVLSSQLPVLSRPGPRAKSCSQFSIYPYPVPAGN